MAECPVCNVLKKTCRDLGDEEFCDKLIEDLKKDKITEQELVDKVTSRFSPDKFSKAWDKNVDATD